MQVRRVRMTRDAIENYGEKYAGRVFVIDSVSNKYMPAEEFFASGMPAGYHPGYDEGAGGYLYDLSDAETGEELPFSLYDWEIVTL